MNNLLSLPRLKDNIQGLFLYKLTIQYIYIIVELLVKTSYRIGRDLFSVTGHSHYRSRRDSMNWTACYFPIFANTHRIL